MTKKAKTSFLILVWSIVAIQMYVNYQEQENRLNRTVTAFSVIDDSMTREWVRGCGYFGEMEISEELCQKMLKNLANKLGITDGYALEKVQGESGNGMALTKKGKQADTRLQILGMPQTEGEPRQYVSVEISTGEGAKEAWKLYKKVERIYEELGMDGNVSFESEMEREGDYVTGNREAPIREILDLTDAKQVDAVRGNGICTVYGYTKKVDSYITLNGEKVNLQIALFYDENTDSTHIKIGIPIVNSSF